ncbi:MAG: hypothetical protein LBP76_00920 [Treponema sp.]|jgi:hypothetical protein|nr:hypothetical protein [Treponema sp.]
MKTNESITEKALEAMTERVKQNVKIFTEVEERRELDINKIEAMWGAAKADVNKVMDKLYNELVNDVPEAELLEKLVDTRWTQEKEGILYIMMDGTFITTRERDESGSSWQENKLGLIFNSNDLHRRRVKGAGEGETHCDITKQEYVSYLGSAEEFKKHLYDCALRNGYGQFRTTVIVSDGATWIRNIAEELFPDAEQILDLFHLKENIYRFGKYLFGDDGAGYTGWAETLIGLAEDSRTEELLGRVEQYQGKRMPAGIVNIYSYVYNNRLKIDYAGYRAKGYYVGSGPVESGNKRVLQRCCKQAGMRWNHDCAQHMLTLCAKAASDPSFLLSA